MPNSDKIRVQREFEAFIEAAYRISRAVGEEVELVLMEGRERPLPREQAREMLMKVVTALRNNGRRRGDAALVKALEGDIHALVERLIEVGGPRPPAPPGEWHDQAGRASYAQGGQADSDHPKTFLPWEGGRHDRRVR